MRSESRPGGAKCPVCGTEMPDDPKRRRCARCGARLLRWVEERPCDRGIVLFNARIGGLTAGAFIAMMGLLLLGYRVPLTWGIAVIALALPFVGYALFGEGAKAVPRSWRTHYLVGVLALNAGLLIAAMAAVLGLLSVPALAATVPVVAAVAWPLIHRAVVASTRDGDS